MDSGELADVVAESDVMVNTIPADAVARYAATLAAAPLLLDAIYDPWPTPLAERSSGRRPRDQRTADAAAPGVRQVEQFTGLPAPREAMTAALGVH